MKAAFSPTRAIAFLAAAWAGVLFVILRSSYWAYDDWLYFYLSRRDGAFSKTWLTSIYFQHVAPGHRALTSVVADSMPISYAWGLVGFLVLLVGAAVLLEACARLLWGPRWVHVVAAVLLLVTFIHVRALIWWSAGLQMFPTLLLELACVYGFLRYRAEGRARWQLLSLAALALGLMFYIRPLVMPVYLVLIEVLLLPGSLHPRAIATRVWARRRVWLGYALVCGAYLAYWLGRKAYAGTPPGQALTVGNVTEYIQLSWLRDYAPSLLGVRVDPDPTGGQQLAVVLAQVLVIGLVAFTVARCRNAWRAWTFFVLTGVISLLVTAQRIKNGTAQATAFDTRYMVELSWLFPFALCAAFAGPSPLPARALRPRPAVGLPNWRVAAPVLAALALLGVLSARTARDLERAWPGAQAHGFVEHLRTGLHGVDAHAALADREVADYLMPAFSFFNQLHNIAPFITGSRPTDGQPGAGVLAVSDNGTVTAATVRDTFHIDLLRRHGPAAPVITNAQSTRRGTRGLCISAGAGAARIVLRAPHAVKGARLYAAIQGTGVNRPVSLPAMVDAGDGTITTPALPLMLGATPATSVLWLQTPSAATLALDVPPNNSACLRSVHVGPLASSPAATTTTP